MAVCGRDSRAAVESERRPVAMNSTCGGKNPARVRLVAGVLEGGKLVLFGQQLAVDYPLS